MSSEWPKIQRGRPLTWSRLRRFFDTGNVVRFLVALILAFAFWAWVTNATDPEITRTIPAVQVTQVNLPTDLQVVGSLPTVEVGLEGPRSRILSPETGAVVAEVDLNDVTQPGTYSRPVQVRVIGVSGIRVTSVTPDRVTVQVDRLVGVARPSTSSA